MNPLAVHRFQLAFAGEGVWFAYCTCGWASEHDDDSPHEAGRTWDLLHMFQIEKGAG